jgi:nucleotidyltransferase/DNA polymerase involved in DNA repair
MASIHPKSKEFFDTLSSRIAATRSSSLVEDLGLSFCMNGSNQSRHYHFEPMREALAPIIAKVWRHCQATGIRGRTVTLKVKFVDFQQITRSKSVDEAIDSLADLERLSLGLLEPLLPPRKGVRLLGISLSSLTQAQATGRQLSLVLR